MGYQHKPNKGTIFRNKTSDAQSKYGGGITQYYSGSANVDGKDYTIRAYIEETKNGTPVYKLDFREMTAAAVDPNSPIVLDQSSESSDQYNDGI
jgi:hypothetical protein